MSHRGAGGCVCQKSAKKVSRIIWMAPYFKDKQALGSSTNLQ